MTATAIIGDIHGRADHLTDLIWKVRERYGDDVRFICVGDFIDRGPDSKEVIEIAVQEGIEGLLGNHEVWLVSYLLNGEINMREVHHPMMGADATLRSYAEGTGLDLHNGDLVARDLKGLIPESHQTYLKNLSLFLKVEVGGVRYWVTHGGIKAAAVERIRHAAKDNPMLTEDLLAPVCAQVELDSIIWEHFDNGGGNSLYRFEDGSVQVFGHAPQAQVKISPWYIALDTGSGRTTRKPNVLSAVVLTDDGGQHTITGGEWRRPMSQAIAELYKEWDSDTK
jgi:hypothetical protein